MKIVSDKNIPFATDFFAHLGDVELLPSDRITADTVRHADMLLIRSITQVNQSLIKESSIKFVGSMTAGIDHLDTDWLDQANIQWAYAPGCNADTVTRYVGDCLQALNQKPGRAAVVGVGEVGSRVVRMLKQKSYEVLQNDPPKHMHDEINDVDLICLHTPLTKTGNYPTYHMIDKHFLSKQKPGCVLLNAGRGAVINTKDLLSHGQHLQWVFDVWEGEPNINPDVLKKATIATPHIAGYSLKAKYNATKIVYETLSKKYTAANAPSLASNTNSGALFVKKLTRELKKTRQFTAIRNRVGDRILEESIAN